MTMFQTRQVPHLEAGLVPFVPDATSRLKASLPIAFVVFYFTAVSINVMPSIIPPAMLAGVLCGGMLYHRELFYFAMNNKLIILYLVVVLASASWSEVPFKSLWYGLQLCATIGAAFIIAVAATPRQIVRGVFIAMALIVVASIASGRKGASAVGPVLVGVTGGKTAMGLAAVVLFASAMALLFDSRQPILYRLAARRCCRSGPTSRRTSRLQRQRSLCSRFRSCFLACFRYVYCSGAGGWHCWA